jgi:acetyl-CoA carboxylase carboxyl transferase subunit alpha
MLSRWLPFEEDLGKVEEQIEELKRLAVREHLDLDAKIAALEDHYAAVTTARFARLSPWEKVQLARHPRRPYTLDYANALCSAWFEMHGDRAFGDDGAMVAGFGRFRGRSVAIIGNQKGRDTRERQERNFGQPSPEGFRKAERVMQLAARFGRPIISLIDTPGAACTPQAEERGISEAIAHSQWLMSQLPVPIIVVIIGEGCSGGAIATALGDRVLMLEYSYYSVISPEGCASILYRDAPEENRARVTQDLKITAQDALQLGVVEEVIPEPLGGAHRNLGEAARNVGDAVEKYLREVENLAPQVLVEQRYRRFRDFGDWENKVPHLFAAASDSMAPDAHSNGSANGAGEAAEGVAAEGVEKPDGPDGEAPTQPEA